MAVEAATPTSTPISASSSESQNSSSIAARPNTDLRAPERAVRDFESLAPSGAAGATTAGDGLEPTRARATSCSIDLGRRTITKPTTATITTRTAATAMRTSGLVMDPEG
jgi:hypothetical protein